MRSTTLLLLLVLAAAMWQPHLPVANADEITSEVTLYAHTDPSATSLGGRVLSLSSNATLRSTADVRDALTFTLIPNLSAPLQIVGPIQVYVWLMAQETVRGTLRVAISEIAADGSMAQTRSASVGIGIPSFPYLVIFGLAELDRRLEMGSTLRLEVQCTPARPLPVTLIWDDPSASTRVVLQVETIPRIDLKISDASGRTSTIFPENASGPVKLLAQVSVEDPFHGINLRKVSLSLANSSGFSLINSETMNLTSRTERPLRFQYALPMIVYSGSFSVIINVRDAADRVFVVTREITVTKFYALVLMMIDSQTRPMPDLNVSVSAGDQLIDEVTTSSDGRARTRVPSSGTVGPLTLQVRKTTIMILSQKISVESDSTLQFELPLYDWNPIVKLQGLNIRVAGASVDLYLNGTLVGSATSDGNGVAHFASVPLGTYEIRVTSFLASQSFMNVTHSSQAGENVLELQPVSMISQSAILLLAVVIIFAVFGLFMAFRRRSGGRGFKHVAELLGGTIPQADVVMIVGPSGSGKSLLLKNVLADSLQLGRHCVYVSNAELPSRIREQLMKLGSKVQACEDENRLRFIDAHSGMSEAVSAERHSVRSPTDLTALGIQLTRCIEEVGGVADVFFDSLTPIVMADRSQRGLDFVRYYGSRTTKSGGTFLFVIIPAIGTDLLGRFEEASDCVLETEKSVGTGKTIGRLLVKKARGLEHERHWMGFRIMSNGRIEFVRLPNQED